MTDEIRKSLFESNPSGKQGEGHLEKNMIKKHSNTATDIVDRKNIDQLQRYCATAAVHGRRGATATSANFGFPAVGNGVGALVRPSLTSMVGTRLRSWCSASLRIRPHGQQLSDWGIESVAGRRDIRPVASPPSTCGNPWSLSAMPRLDGRSPSMATAEII